MTRRKTATNNRFASMPADPTQHQLFVRLSAAVPADRTQMNNRIYFVLWFFNRHLFRADEYKIPAQQQAVNRCVQSFTIMTEEAISITELRHKLDGIASQIPKNIWRFYYIKSISNFIHHLPNFKSERLTIRNAHDINEYLDHVAQRLTQEHDHRKFARELFPRVWKLANDFKLELGFIARPYYPFNIIFWIIIFVCYTTLPRSC